VSADVIAVGLFVALGLGILSSVVPAYASIRTTVVDGLRELD
jgi:ABC-type antimicrobial peptide transport system permease subunit